MYFTVKIYNVVPLWPYLAETMPRKKVTDASSGNGGIKRKRGGGRRKDREFSSDDEFDDFEQENTKKPGRPASKSGLQPVTVADDVKEKIVRALTPLQSTRPWYIHAALKPTSQCPDFQATG